MPPLAPASRTIQSFSTRTPALLLVTLLAAACSSSKADTRSTFPTSSSLPRSESPNLAAVKPPAKPQVLKDERIVDEELAKRPSPKQPPGLTAALLDLEKGSIEERVAKIKAKAINDLVYVRGGSFMRGDFSRLAGFDSSLTYNDDDKVVREITLSEFWIGKYKVTYAEFDVFTDATGRQRTGMEFNGESRHPLIPAGAYWQEAKDYCLWLGKITGHPFDLPTEAQWEYAGRSRGQFFTAATDDGHLDYGRNAPTYEQAKVLTQQYVSSSFGSRYPVGLFPPNPLGLYDMAYHSLEWVNDWYATDAFAKAESNDPSGPAAGDSKVVRSWYIANGQILGTNVWRHEELPMPLRENTKGGIEPGWKISSPTLRCVVNSLPSARP